MKALLVATLTLRRMLHAQYLITAGLLSVACVALFFIRAWNIEDSPSQMMQAAATSVALITYGLCYFGAILLAITVVPEEISSGAMRMNLTKPVRPITVLTGHFLGMLAFIAGTAMVMAVLLTLAMVIHAGEPGWTIIAYVAHLLPVYACFLALGNTLVLLMGRPIGAFVMVFLAHESMMSNMADRASIFFDARVIQLPVQLIGEIGYLIAPPLSRMRIKLGQFESFDFPWEKYALVLLYCASYLILAHLLGAWLLKRKEI
jgi:ABC-type transport system involved in multi-copper enzyme maturation permease subunit